MNNSSLPPKPDNQSPTNKTTITSTIDQIAKLFQTRRNAGKHLERSKGRPRLAMLTGFASLYIGLFLDILAIGIIKQPTNLSFIFTHTTDASLPPAWLLISISALLFIIGIPLIVTGIRNLQTAINNLPDDEVRYISRWAKNFLLSAFFFLILEILTLVTLLIQK